ncbi:MAG: nucleoside monophosphate kinase [Planctomycetota bacterium]|jgi:adenylate kinase family enzyme
MTIEPPTDDSAARRRAILLLGPTGSGKTPLGDLIAERGLWSARCLHFDFGASLRRIVEGSPDPSFSRDDVDFLRRVLQSGALLENEHFPLAKRIFRSFLAARGADDHTVVLLNGLPRHAGQAGDVDRIVRIEAVVCLRCPRDTVLARIRADVGGDRAGRDDDDPRSVAAKLRLFDERTAPLLEHYRRLQARIETIDVTASMTPQQAWQILDRRR